MYFGPNLVRIFQNVGPNLVRIFQNVGPNFGPNWLKMAVGNYEHWPKIVSVMVAELQPK